MKNQDNTQKPMTACQILTLILQVMLLTVSLVELIESLKGDKEEA
jgi:hypothetical protein